MQSRAGKGIHNWGDLCNCQASTQAVEHCEITRYGALTAGAREMGHGDFADIGDNETTLGPPLTWIRAGIPRKHDGKML